MGYYETLERWQELKEAIAKLQAEERALREGLFNKYELPDGRILKANYPLRRSVVESNLSAVPKDIREKVFKEYHKLSTGAYRELTDAQRAKVDIALNIKPGLPSLEIVEAKAEARSIKF